MEVRSWKTMDMGAGFVRFRLHGDFRIGRQLGLRSSLGTPFRAVPALLGCDPTLDCVAGLKLYVVSTG